MTPYRLFSSNSFINVTFTTPNKDLDAKFVKESIEAGMTNLKGHRSVGGIRASIYNAMPYVGVVKVTFISDLFSLSLCAL